MSVAQSRRISTLIAGRFARSMIARASGSTVALSRLWPGRTDRLIIAPHDLRTADATRAAEIYAGRFVFAGKIVTCHGRSIFDLEPPSEDWEAALLGFGWLRHLRAADTALTRANARSLVDDWISNQARKRPLERRADVRARRVISLLSQAPLVLGDTDGKFYRKYLRGLAREIRYLRHATLDNDGVPRLQVLIALCYASLCLANQARNIKSATRRLSDELQRQILPDGGHISRNPGALVELLSDLLPLRQTFAARNIAPPPALLNAIDRMMPMLRFFRHGDGSFALFNGMSTAPSDLVATLLAYDDTRGVPMASMPHTGFQRLDAGNTALIIDTGPPPPASVSQDAHAGCLSFELSSGVSRIVVNCGMPSTGRDNWRPFARSTAAHSTLTYRDTSSCQFVELSAMKRLLRGAPITSGPSNVESYREAVPDGDVLTASHDGYLSRFGVIHRRVLMVAQDGTRLEGEDSLSPAPGGRIKGSEADFALRFHLHPSVKASRLSDARGVMLVLPNRDVWTFEAMDDKVDLEDSVFLAGNDGPRRTSQIVIRQDARQAGTIRWSFVRSSTSASATTARRNARREPELPL
ncbi:putative heparinase superfamily protein [Bradyrhizobium elkanii]|uniref:Putative heparinase superfamily protein n=1 Tax=Bradyrhizobium elkanii TaxID=29448 RepID=A0A1E3EHX2_BRAEL|nr:MULTISPECIES: heparinase II/III family protein [Bradyrhizobium]MBP1292308.1 putative heparinase superfamily protein [Bradyrhizobium elkanii]MCP1927195.1 putative heparinase superfamily protein [Bradyrhizobium elkanii]MCP1974178.1 putative heparinase superfamily protein [Bradyrhizobium elkanii]MCS3475287.1 putative heparinase superfamily protein [Bradyrhizobium elkanii]MCS3521299.1 putative heparinase superfamily protein [Bradyrhizobium elkanii]